MKSRKIVSLLLAVTVAGGLLAGCGSDANASTDNQSNEADAAVGETAAENSEAAPAEAEDNSETAAEKEKVTLRLADMSVYGIAIFNYAEEIGLLDGYFDDLENYEITVELSEWASGVDQNTAYAAGEIDFSSMGNIPAVTGASNGYGTKILAVNYLYDDEYVLVAREGSGIENVEDLAGRNVGTYVGTVTHYAVAKYLESAGLTVDDVNLLNVGAETATSLRSGDIDAGILGKVVAQQLEADGTGYILSDEKVPIYNYVVGNEEFAQKYPDITVRVLQLINDTWDYAMEHQEEYEKFYANAAGVEVETVQAAWEDNFPIKSAKDFDDTDYASYVEFIDWMKSIEYVSEDVEPDELLDLTYVKQLQ